MTHTDQQQAHPKGSKINSYGLTTHYNYHFITIIVSI